MDGEKDLKNIQRPPQRNEERRHVAEDLLTWNVEWEGPTQLSGVPEGNNKGKNAGQIV